MVHQLRLNALNRPHQLHHPSSHRFQQGHRQAFTARNQQNRLARLQQRLHLLGGNATVEVDSVGEAALMNKLLAGCSVWTVPDQVDFNLPRDPAGVDEGVHHLMDALLALHHAAAIHHAERLIREAGLGRWQRDAVRDHLRAAGGQALAQQLGKELGEADAAGYLGFRCEAFGDAPVIGSSECMVKIQGRLWLSMVGQGYSTQRRTSPFLICWIGPRSVSHVAPCFGGSD